MTRKRNAVEDDAATPLPLPRQTMLLVGHDLAEQAFLAAWRSARVPHAWLIGGEPGIGKATLAYRIARFVLAHPDRSDGAAQSATSLALDPSHPTARRIAANAHTDLLALERTAGETGKLRTVITVDQVRRLTTFFGSTAGEGGWRIAIIDTADELKAPEGSNALLKMLEEPPARSLFLLVSNAPGRLLPTIRSRCRQLALKPLRSSDLARAAAAALGDGGSVAFEPTALSGGSVARVLAMTAGPISAMRAQVTTLLRALPATDPAALHALGDQLDRGDRSLFEGFVDVVRDWLSARLDSDPKNLRRLARAAAAWDRINGASRDVETYNLDRKPLVFAVFGLLAEACRG